MEKTIHSKAHHSLRGWLKKKRAEKKLTQRDLALLLQVPHSWVGKVETGERKLDVVEFCRICKILDIDPHEGIDECSDNL